MKARGGHATWWVGALAWVLGMWLLAGSAAAAELALLVGVSAYPQLPARLQLQGPANDVRRLRDALRQRGVPDRQIRLLADGVDGAGLPTRAAILSALAALSRQARAGDTVLLHFSGHGSQSPVDGGAADARAEPDGWHEVFLPRDVGPWDGQRGAITNGLTDTQLREAIDRIGVSGAFVWAVFDACHSATLVRGGEGPGDRRLRQVLPVELGVPTPPRRPPRAAQPAPPAATPPATAPAVAAVAVAPAHGRAAYFYAAQSDEPAFEDRLPRGDPAAVPQGVFSHVIARTLAEGRPMTYRQLAQSVRLSLAALGDANAAPQFSGNGLDEPVLGQAAPPVRQWALAQRDGRWTVPAGSLEGIGLGARFELLPDPTAPVVADGAGIGEAARPVLRAAVVQAGLTELVPEPGLAPGAVQPGRYVRLRSNPPAFALRVAVRASGCGEGCGSTEAKTEPLAEAIARLRRDGVPGVEVQWLAADAPGADVVLTATGRGLHYRLPGDEDGLALPAQRPLGWALPTGPAGTPAALARTIAQDLHRLARTRNLLRVAERLVARSGPGAPQITLAWRPAQGGGRQRVLPEQRPTVHSGDGLALQVRNPGPLALDVAVLALTADQGVALVYPDAAGESSRLRSGDVLPLDDEIIVNGARSAGVERLVVLWAPARRGADPRDFSVLTQRPLSRRQGGEPDPVLQALLDACFADHVRRGEPVPAPPAEGLGMQVFTFRVQP